MLKERLCTLTSAGVFYGRLIINKEAREIFPDTAKSVKILVELDGCVLTRVYNGKWHILYGLAGWFRDNNIVAGEEIRIQKFGKNTYALKLAR